MVIPLVFSGRQKWSYAALDPLSKPSRYSSGGRRGNSGSGLGAQFANTLHKNLHHVFRDFGAEKITKSSHLENHRLDREVVKAAVRFSLRPAFAFGSGRRLDQVKGIGHARGNRTRVDLVQ